MKRKMQPQIQSCEIRLPRNDRSRADITSFLQAVDSYPARVAEQPSLTFHQHLRTFLDSSGSRRRGGNRPDESFSRH